MGTHPIFESDFDCLTEMGQSKSKAFDVDKIEKLDDEKVFARKKLHLEPDLIGAKLAARAKCVAVMDEDMVFRMQPQEKKSNGVKQPVDHYLHHPSGFIVKPKTPDGNFYFANVNRALPKLPYDTMQFSSKYNRVENGEEVEMNLSIED